MQSNPSNEVMNTVSNEETPLKKEVVDDAPNNAERPSPEDKSISVSIEDLKSIYERNKSLKAKELIHFEKVHQNPIRSLILTSDDRYIISSSTDGSIKVIDIHLKQQVYHFENGPKSLASISALSRPGFGDIAPVSVTSEDRSLIFGFRDGSIKVFDCHTKEEVYYCKNAQIILVNSLAGKCNPRFIINACSYRSTKVFDLHAREEIGFENIDEIRMGSVIILTSDYRFIISANPQRRSIKIFDFQTKQQVHHFQSVHQNKISSMIVTTDDRILISTSYGGSIKVFDIHAGELIHHFQNVHQYAIDSTIMTSDNRFLVSISCDRSIKVFDIHTKEEVHHFQNILENSFMPLTATFDNRFIIISSHRSLKVLDLHTKQQVHHFKDAHQEIITALNLTSDNRFLISGSFNGSIKVFDLYPQQFHNFYNDYLDQRGPSRSMTVTLDGKYVISDSKKSIKIFDLHTRKEIHCFKDAHEDDIISVLVTSDNKFIISTSEDGALKVFDFYAKEEIYSMKKVHSSEISSMIMTPDDRCLISTSRDGSIKVFDIHTGKETHNFQNVHQSWGVLMVATSESRFVISGSERSLKVFDLHTKQQVHYFKDALKHRINTLNLTFDNRFIISGLNNGSIQVFNLDSGEEVHHFKNAQQGTICSLAVTPCDRFIISVGSSDPSIKIFDLQTKQQVFHFRNAHEDIMITLQNENPSIIVTSDCRYIVAGSIGRHGRSVKIFDFNTKQLVCHLDFHEKDPGLSMIAISDKLIISGCNSIKVLSFETKQEKEFEFNLKDEKSISIPDRAIFNQELYFIYERMREFSIFNSADNFLFDKPAESSVLQARQQPELFVLPFRWTILHVVALYENHDFLEKLPDYRQFQIPFLLDAFNNTPLHYLLRHKNVNSITANIIFRYICDYLEGCYSKNPFEFQQIIKSLSLLLSFIFQKTEMKLRQKFLRIVFTGSPAPFRNPVPTFGNILLESAIFCSSPVLTQETRDNIWNVQGTMQIEFRSNFLCLDYDILSEDMSHMIDYLKKQEGEDFFKISVIVRLIDHLWQQAKIPLLIIYVFYLAFIIALFVYLALGERSLAYEITLLVISVFFTANEFWQMFHSKRAYLENLWNWIDISHLLLTIAFLGTRIAESHNELARAWISSIIIILGCLRCISILKIYEPTRNLIQAIITSTKDMMSFVIIIVLIIIGISLIFLMFNRGTEYGDCLYQAYNVLYGPMDLFEDANWIFSQKLLMSVLAFFLCVVLLNLLIAIMYASYDQVLEMREKTDSLTRLEMISEAVIYKKFWKPNHQTKRGYLVYCLPVELEEDEDDQNQKFESGMKAIKNFIQQNNEESKQEIQALMKNEKLSWKESNEKMIYKLKLSILEENNKVMKAQLFNFMTNNEVWKDNLSSLETRNEALKDKISNLEASNQKMENEILNLKHIILRGFSELQAGLNHPIGGFSKQQAGIDSAAFKKELLEDSDPPQPEDISFS